MVAVGCKMLCYACGRAPITGRLQFILLSEADEDQMGLSAYQQALRDERLSRDRCYNEFVTRVGQRIAAVANCPDYAWEFRGIDKDIANALALPGSKAVVYTGLFKFAQTDAGLGNCSGS